MNIADNNDYENFERNINVFTKSQFTKIDGSDNLNDKQFSSTIFQNENDEFWKDNKENVKKRKDKEIKDFKETKQTLGNETQVSSLSKLNTMLMTIKVNSTINKDQTIKKKELKTSLIRCHSLYAKGSQKLKQRQEKFEQSSKIKENLLLSECTFQPEINNNKASNNYRKSNYDRVFVDNYNIYNLNKEPRNHSNLYDKYKNIITNKVALKNKEVYIKKKIDKDFSQKEKINHLDFQEVFNNEKNVNNNKHSSTFIKRYQMSRLKSTENIKKLQSTSMRFFSGQSSVSPDFIYSLRGSPISSLREILRNDLSSIDI